MTFALPWLLVGALLLPVFLVLLHRWSERRANRKLASVVAFRLREALLQSVDFGRRWKKVILLSGAFAMLAVTLARPLFGFQLIETERSSVDFFVALDLSRSMLAEDVEGQSRLAAAKETIAHMLDHLSNDRVGLIAFAGDAFVAAPVTQDHESVKRNLAALETTAIAKQGSDMAKAIELALKTFEAGKYETKALVLVTDGEELQGDAVVAARTAAQKGMKVFTLGVGSSAGSRIAERRDGPAARYARNEFGGEVITRLNERMLQQVAASGSGFYEGLGMGDAGLVAIWRRGLEPMSKGTQTRPSKDLQEFFQWPLALAIALLLGEMLVSDRRQRPAVNRP